MKKAISMFAVAALAAGVFAVQAGSQANPAGGFDRLTTLVGEWNVTPEGGKTFTSTIRYVSNSTALEETFDGEKHIQMVTLYTADGDRVALTHFCSMGNQPRMETPFFYAHADDF